MRIAVVAESLPGETRVACVPETVGALTGLGHRVLVEPGAGRGALIGDETYAAAGAEITGRPWTQAELVLGVQPLAAARRAELSAGVATLSFLTPLPDLADLRARRDQRLTTFAFDRLPRSARAQPMDALTSQSLIAGYRGAVLATERLRRFVPLAMTAAGTIEPVRVLVLGAGVAGLQALTTIRRSGAETAGFDVRPAAAAEIASTGARPLDLGLAGLGIGSGYARTLDAGQLTAVQSRLAPHVAAADALITTAAVPGRRAPVLVSRSMVAAMAPGSVVIDLAAGSGGNVEGVSPGGVVRIGAADVWGEPNPAAQLPVPASRLYARNVANLVALLTRDGRWALDVDDPIVDGCCLTHDGLIRDAALAASAAGDE